MTITVKTPDGGTAQFPDGTPTSTMTSALQAKFGGPAAKPAEGSFFSLTGPGSTGGSTGAAINNALFQEGKGGTAFASADEGILPAARDYALAGADDLTMGALRAHAPTSVGNAVAQAHSNLGPMDYVESGAAYGLGPGKILGPAGKAIGGAGIGGMAAEGALAGGVNAAVGSQDPSLGGIAGGALTGGVMGGAAGGLTKGVNAGLQKALGSPGSIDPAAAITATKTARDNLYGQLQNIPVGANSLKNAYASATLTPGMAADVSPGFNTLIGRQLEQVDAGGITANDVADFAKNLRAGATSNGDQILAGKISDNLLGALPPEAQSTLQAADAAHKQYMMAQNLAQWQRQVQAGGSPGQKPLTEAERFYDPGSPEYNTLVGLANQSQGHSGLTYAAGHLASGALGFGGETLAGFPGAMIGEGLGLLYVRPAIYKAMKGVDQRAKLKAFQQAYPQMTGQPLTGVQQGPQVGDAIKNLMLGSAY